MAGEFHQAHAAGLNTEESALFLGAAAELDLTIAQDLAPVQKPGTVLEHGLQQAHGIGQIVGLNGAEGFEPKGLEVVREFFFGDLRHGLGTGMRSYGKGVMAERLAWRVSAALASVRCN